MAVICVHDLSDACAVGLNELKLIKNICKILITAYRNSEHNIIQFNTGGKTSDRSEFDSVVIDADESTGMEGVIPMYQQI